jgi:flavin-dependent dehydrogenase
MVEHERYDVVILGGGLAGLSLAIQLKRARPGVRLLVAERSPHPLPEAAVKVGEATVEVGADYFSNVIGMKEHLQTCQLPKLALRFFFGADGNHDITRRLEVGVSDFALLPSYQLDRGRMENALGERARELGAEFLDGCKVQDVMLGGKQHTVTLVRGSKEMTIEARWVVDASGRASILKRKLGLARKNDHEINAAWFRIGKFIKVDDWSEDPAWQARMAPRPRHRWLSTNQLMGPGYWVWLIPLASGSHSIGIVADPRFHPFDEFNTFERALAWLRKHEPQCAEKVEAERDLLQDFRVMKNYSHGCKRVYSPDRWCLTGEAGVFIDPFYSPGSDFIATSNSFITALIDYDLRVGSRVRLHVLARIYNAMYLAQYETGMVSFQDQYKIFGNTQVFSMKHYWDYAFYWAFAAVLSFKNKWPDVVFMVSVLGQIMAVRRLHCRMQRFFLEWGALEKRQWSGMMIDATKLEFVRVFHGLLAAEYDDHQLRARLKDNLRILEWVAVEMFRRAAPLVGSIPEGRPINPYAISLRPERWAAEHLFDARERPTPTDFDVAADIHRLTLAFRS